MSEEISDRDLFAAHAMQALLANPNTHTLPERVIVHRAYRIADAMLVERVKTPMPEEEKNQPPFMV